MVGRFAVGLGHVDAPGGGWVGLGVLDGRQAVGVEVGELAAHGVGLEAETAAQGMRCFGGIDGDDAAPSTGQGQALLAEGGGEAPSVRRGVPGVAERLGDLGGGNARPALGLPVLMGHGRPWPLDALGAAVDARDRGQPPPPFEGAGAGFMLGIGMAVMGDLERDRMDATPDDMQMRPALLAVLDEDALMADQTEGLLQGVGGL